MRALLRPHAADNRHAQAGHRAAARQLRGDGCGLSVIRTCALAFGIAVPSAVHAQRMAPAVMPTSPAELRVANSVSLRAATMSAGVGTQRLLVSAKPAPPALAQADSLIASDTHAQTGALIGGFVGAVGGALAFAHFTHRAGATNSTTGTVGGAIVGAGLIGTLGALVGLVIGSSIHQ